MRPGRLEVGISLGLVALTLIAYGGLFGGDYQFVNFDDYDYVRDNPQVHAGLTRKSLWWALTNLSVGVHWHPLTWISLQLDYQLWGLNPRGFHLTNLLLHTANAVLLFLLVRSMTGATWPAAAVAAFFAVHPIHVESVAWVTERKDVLSTLFWMLTLLAYIRYAERPCTGRYLLVLLGLTLGLMSKAMLVTVPCVLLLLDYWPLRRWPRSLPEGAPGADAPGEPQLQSRFAPASFRQLVLEKVPLFLLCAGCVLLTIRANAEMIDDANRHFSFSLRLLNALVSYVSYLRQTFWPSDLAVLYLHAGEEVLLAQGLAAGLLLAGVTCLALWWRRSRPYLLVGWLWYLGTLVPVIGILQVAHQARADRYTYVPLIGIFLALSWGAAEWLGRRRSGRVALTVATAGLLIGCTAVTWSQLRHWQNSISLWNRALQVSGDDPRMHFMFAETCLREGQADLALRHAERILELQPDNADGHRLLAMVLANKGKLDEATASMARAVDLRPESADFRKQMARFLWLQGRIPAAYEQFAVVARLQPDSAEGQHYLGTVLQRQEKLADAVHCFERAVRLAAGSPLYHCDLAFAFEEQGNHRAAVTEYDLALRIYPDWPLEYNRVAQVLATHPDALRRDGSEAVRRAREACFVTNYRHPPFLETLAAAYAEAGRFERAIATAEQAHKLAVEARETKLVDRLEQALQAYRNEQPFRDSELK